VKHANGGEVLVRATATQEIELLAIDRGPGIADVRAALADGRSTAGTPGLGLGAIGRLSGEFEIYSTPQGTIVFARLCQSRTPGSRRYPFQVAAVSVAKPGEVECGDAWTITERPDGFVATVADGLGHGHFAAAAAGAVIAAMKSQPQLSGAAALAAVHDAIRHTRGAAAAVVDVTLDRRLVKFAGVGNIAAAVMNNGTARQAVSHNGTLGHEARLFREYTYPWPEHGVLVMSSDGLTTHWRLDPYPGLAARHPAVIAAVLYRDFSRGHDDVTVLVAREAA
jgi:hypothetical protein